MLSIQSMCELLDDYPILEPKKPVEQSYTAIEKMPAELKALQESFSGHWWKYRAYVGAIMHTNTPGYKRQKFILYGTEKGNIIPLRYIDWTKEHPIQSFRKLDLYISGNYNFFCLDSNSDMAFYTYDGRFFRDTNGMLRGVGSHLPVLGEDGKIFLKTDTPYIDEQGNIYEDDQFVAKLKIASFKSPAGLWTLEGSVFFQREPNKVKPNPDPVYKIGQELYEAQNEPPGQKTASVIKPGAESAAFATKKILESYEMMFRTVMD